MSAFAVGQRLILRDSTRRHTVDREVIVAKVGRKWATVVADGGWPEWQVDKESGRGKPDYRGMSVVQLDTAEAFAAADHRQAILNRVAELTRGHAWPNRLSNEQAEAVLAILNEANGGDS